MTNKPFKHQKIATLELDLVKILPLIGQAHASLSNYNGALNHLINPRLLLAPMTAKESAMSSRIEGTQATLTEVLQHEAGECFSGYKYNDIQEILNYKMAMSYAIELLQEKPFIHLNMIREIHKVLLSDVRGESKARGEFRKIQNWIGPKNSTIETASFIPPAPNEIMEYLDEWEKFVNSDYSDILVQLAIVHAQFEIIHPFLDGNGRLGRILIPIFLYSKNYLTEPIFYLSEYLEKNREEYYDRLRDITKNNNWQDWVEFFLKAIVAQANQNRIKIKEVLELHNKQKNIIQEITKSQYITGILDAIFAMPIFTVASFCKYSNIANRNTANAILQKLLDKQIIEQIRTGSGNRGNMYKFSELIDLIDGDE